MPRQNLGGLTLDLTDDRLALRSVLPRDLTTPVPEAALALPLYRIERIGWDSGGFGSMTPAYPADPGDEPQHSVAQNGCGLDFRSGYRDGLSVSVRMNPLGDLPVAEARTVVHNDGETPIMLSHVSSLLLGGIAPEAAADWDELNERFRLHYCIQTWETEGQWKEAGVSDLGLVAASTHGDTNTFRIESRRSFTTCRYWPLLVFEDREAGLAWFIEVEAAGAWALELGHASGWDGGIGSFFMAAHGPSMRDFTWGRILEKGESYESTAALFGCVEGGFDEAIGALTHARRMRRARRETAHNGLPLTFNDYMNCLWGNPTRARLEPLVEAAAEAGCETFCIDAGWFGPVGESWRGMGTYEPADERFGDGGLAGMLDFIRSKGMTPGLWLELEVCNPKCALADKPDDWFLRVGGERCLANSRLFPDFRHEGVRAHFHGVIDRLVAMGVGFIKNDYNECYGPILDGDGVEGVRLATEGFLRFIDQVRVRHPDLVIENCGSGAMRSDNNTLSHFHLQSTSDQEDAVRYAGIVEGSLAQNPPEACGQWAYPWPMEFLSKDSDDFDADAAFIEHHAEIERTILTLVNGLMGSMYLPGRLDRAPAEHRAFIHEATALFKNRIRAHNAASVPFWPLGRKPFNFKGWRAVGLENEQDGSATIAVWRTGGDQEECLLPLRRGWKRVPSAEIQYPSDPRGASVEIAEDGLLVRLPKAPSARLLHLTLE